MHHFKIGDKVRIVGPKVKFKHQAHKEKAWAKKINDHVGKICTLKDINYYTDCDNNAMESCKGCCTNGCRLSLGLEFTSCIYELCLANMQLNLFEGK